MRSMYVRAASAESKRFPAEAIEDSVYLLTGDGTANTQWDYSVTCGQLHESHPVYGC